MPCLAQTQWVRPALTGAAQACAALLCWRSTVQFFHVQLLHLLHMNTGFTPADVAVTGHI
jgi:hypothetical protein